MSLSLVLGALLALSSHPAVAAQPQSCEFVEADYFDFNPDVAAAVRAGSFPSGAAHYGQYGRNEGRLFNRDCIPGAPYGCSFIEGDYLSLNPDVAAAVRSGTFPDGAAHFGAHGFQEGRAFNLNCLQTPPPPPPPPPPPTACAFSERDYLLFNEDVAAAVRNGSFQSGYQHYLQAGRSENRIFNRDCIPGAPYGCSFIESDYLMFNPDVAAAVRNGSFASGAGHYGAHGRYENRVFNTRCR